ncbi:hypothetical protein PGT21_018058 [Puccinia graminis f. sp. tritici]|uniref:Uncharacterized protein n=2 Tax=Puccinia graminis f. sp. tritici TaxID=56615 RepID=E3JPX1_PUCGT|nr:uncharacterized protein PGTG_07278 [Puccinia graminis f. sp. tritici CRL 75-36-700-3]EFP81026.1 hypothetical protein PGTG_07278 [Puccinia graminis f. sp. tritici CRL 75-36-700-3]KAA1080719.1 hypothetical protein PGT21_018058 [Puccinia graminis f. sp. tritici]
MPSRTRGISWINDGAPGGKDSLSLLFEWLKSGNNYARWQSGDDKISLYRDLLAVFMSHGITHRKRCEASLRISCFQMSYNDGRRFLAATGVEVADDPLVKGT